MNPERESFKLPLCGAALENVCALSGETVQYTIDGDILTVTLPKENRAPIATVVEITLNGNVGGIYHDFNPDNFDAFA